MIGILQNIKRVFTAKPIYLIMIAYGFVLMLFCTKSSPLFLFNDWYDANIYFTMGKGFFNGYVPYVDLIDNKGPLLYLIYGLSWLIDHTGFFGVYIFQSAFVSLSIVYAYRLAGLFIKNSGIAFAAAILSPLPMLFEKYYALGFNLGGGGPDEFCRALLVVSLYYFALYSMEPNRYRLRHTAIQGVLFACVFLMKFNAQLLHLCFDVSSVFGITLTSVRFPHVLDLVVDDVVAHCW